MSGLEYIVELIKKVVDTEVLIRWVYEKMVLDYGVEGLEVKRVKDAVVLVVKADSKKLDSIEEELRKAVAALGFGEKIEVEIEGG